MVNQDALPGNWRQMRVRLKERWHGLNNDDLATIAGSRRVLVSILYEKLGYTEQQAEEQVNLFLKQLAPASHA